MESRGWIRYVERGWQSDLGDDAARTWPADLGLVFRLEPDGWHVDVVSLSGKPRLADYAVHDDQLHAALCAEQRYLVEQVGSGAVSGDTYSDKAEERIRRWREGA